MGGERVTIVEAIKATTEEKPYITREKWDREFRHVPGHRFPLLATDTRDGIMLAKSMMGFPKPRWNPEREDLIADDWIVFGPDQLPEWNLN